MSALIKAAKPIWLPGRKYHQAGLRTCPEGLQDAELVREPTNEYDPNAIQVMVGAMLVGYLPRAKAAQLAPYMDDAGLQRLGCQIDVYHPSPRRVLYGCQFLGVYRPC